MISTLTSKGQITIPKAIRDNLHISTGDKLDFRVNADGVVGLVPIKKSIDEVFGCLAGKVKNKLSIEDMNSKIAKRYKNFK